MEHAQIATIKSSTRSDVIDLSGKTDLLTLAALVRKARLLITVDSAPMHFAAAWGTPQVVLFGPTNPFGTAPVTPHCSIVQQKPYCSPCFLRRCPTDHRCMTAITANMVEAAARPWLSSIQVQRA